MRHLKQSRKGQNSGQKASDLDLDTRRSGHAPVADTWTPNIFTGLAVGWAPGNLRGCQFGGRYIAEVTRGLLFPHRSSITGALRHSAGHTHPQGQAKTTCSEQWKSPQGPGWGMEAAATGSWMGHGFEVLLRLLSRRVSKFIQQVIGIY